MALSTISNNGTSMSLDGTNIQSSTTGSGNAGKTLYKPRNILPRRRSVSEQYTTGVGKCKLNTYRRNS